MDARKYRTNLKRSPLDFPPIMGLGESSVSYQSEPKMNNDKVVLSITKTYILRNMDTDKEHEVLSVQSEYEIPTNEIKTREDVYEFYKDANLGLNEAYQFAGTKIPELPKIVFPNVPMENYKGEIDRVFSLLNSRN